jgi:hypothetical protein
MAGQDQSRQLGGMLSQIGETVGQGAQAFAPVMNAAMKPRGDMNDPAHLQALAQWASSTGDQQGAAMYMQQAQQLRSEQKRASDATMLNGATAQYKAARESGDAKAIAEAEQGVIDASNATGSDAHARLDAVQSSLSRAEEAAYVQGERQAAAEEKKALEDFTKQLNSVTDAADIQAIVEGADEKVAPVAQRAATARLAYLEAQTVRQERDALNEKDVTIDLTINKDLPPAIVAAHEAELKGLEARAEAGFVNGTWNTPTMRQEIVDAREALAKKIYGATYSKEMQDYSVETARLRDYNGKSSRVAISTPTTKQAAEIKKELQEASEAANEAASELPDLLKGWEGSDTITVEAINAEFRRQQMVALDAEFNDVLPPTGEQKTYTPEEAAKLPKGTKFVGTDGNTYTA